MRNLFSMLVLLVSATAAFAQSPHGEAMKTNCAACHTPDGWDIPAETWKGREPEKPVVSKVTGWALPQDTLIFNHNKKRCVP